jgi:phosphosulfolactate synthase (CoM biosynthesis protein A)
MNMERSINRWIHRVCIQFGAGGATRTEELEAEGTKDPGWPIQLAGRFIDAGAYLIMAESEGISGNVRTWRTDAVAKFVEMLGLEKLMFEASAPDGFAWYVKHHGPEVNLTRPRARNSQFA